MTLPLEDTKDTNPCRGWKLAAAAFCIVAGLAAVGGAIAFLLLHRSQADSNIITVDTAIERYLHSRADLRMVNSSAYLNGKMWIPLLYLPLSVEGLTRPVEFASPVFQVTIPSHLLTRNLTVEVDLSASLDASSLAVSDGGASQRNQSATGREGGTSPTTTQFQILAKDFQPSTATVDLRCTTRNGCSAREMFQACEAASCVGAVIDGGPGDTNFGNRVSCRYLVQAVSVCRVIEQTSQGWAPSTITPYCDWPFMDPKRQCGNWTHTSNGTGDKTRLQLRVKDDPYLTISEATEGTFRFQQSGSSFSTAFAAVILVIGIALITVGVATIVGWWARRRRREHLEASARDEAIGRRTAAVPPRFQRRTPMMELDLPEIDVQPASIVEAGGTSADPFSDPPNASSARVAPIVAAPIDS